MTNLDQAVLDVARDAIREGRHSDIAGIVVDQPKGDLLGDALQTVTALARALGVGHFSICPFADSCHVTMSVDAPADVDRVFEDLEASGAMTQRAPHQFVGDDIEWRQAVVDLGTLHITVNGPHTKLTPAEKRKRTIARKKAAAENPFRFPADIGDSDIPF